MDSHTTEQEQAVVRRLSAELRVAREEQPEYDYFAFVPTERLPELKTMIETKEKQLFQLQLAKLTLEGNPSAGQGLLTHDQFKLFMEREKIKAEKAGEPFIQMQGCPCPDCELDRLDDAIDGTIFALNKIRALYGKTVG